MVMVIIGILAAVVGPRFFDRRVFDERLYYEEVPGAVRYAQKLALASGCPVRAQVGAAGYALSYAAACGGLVDDSPCRQPRGRWRRICAGSATGVAIDLRLDYRFNSGLPVRQCCVPGWRGRADGRDRRLHLQGARRATGFIESLP